MTVVVMRPFRSFGKSSFGKSSFGKSTQAEMNQPAAKIVAFFENERKRAKERKQ